MKSATQLAWMIGLCLFCAAPAGAAETRAEPEATPKWIWHSAAVHEKGAKPVEGCFRREVTIPPGAEVATAVLAVTADASVCRVYVNGQAMGEKLSDWRSVWGLRVSRHLKPGKNVIAIVAGKPGGAAGLIGRLTVRFESGPPLEVLTDRHWKKSAETRGDWTAAEFDDSRWAAAHEIGPLGIGPWANLAMTPSRQIVPWPAVPKTRPLTAEQTKELIEADWMQQAGNDPSPEDVAGEIEAARRIAARFSAHDKPPAFARELAELDRIAAQLRATAGARRAEDEAPSLYLAARRAKRQIVLANPAIDFQRLLLIDGSPPGGHESGHRNTYGGDLARIGTNRIVVLDGLRPDADARDVVPGIVGGVMRMDLHFDADRLVYSFVGRGNDSFHLYEVDLGPDGVSLGPPRQLTSSPYHDMDPIYLPDGKIAFCTTRGNTYVRCLPNSPCTVLARCEADGKNIRLISNNNEPDYTPCLLPDGRILYTRWEYTERPLWRLQALWTMNPDGTGLAHYYGNRSNWPDMLWEARPIPGTQRVMFTGVGHHDVGGGPIGIVDVAEGRDFPDGLYKVTAEVPWTEVGDPREGNRTYSSNYRGCTQFSRFASPYPLSTHDFLVSARGGRHKGDSGGYWLYLMDIDGNRELIYVGTGNRGVWCAMPLRPRPRPPVVPDRVAWPKAGDKPAPGVFYSGNVYEGPSGLPRGAAKYLRVLQQDHKTYSMGGKSFRHSGPVISALQEDAVKRILGTVPIAEDGSVAFKAPAGAAVYFQLLDAEHRCLQIMRSFVGVMPGENRGCVGCHESHSTAPGPSGPRRYEPAELTPPPWGAHVSVSYERFAQPVLDKHCGKCHQGDGKGRAVLDLTLRGGVPELGINDPKLLPFKEPYLTLIGSTAWVGRQPHIDPKGKGYGLAGALPVESGYRGDPYAPIPPMRWLSYTSPLIKLATSGKHNDVKIEGEDLLRLIAWVDCNCVYRGEEEVRQIPDPDAAQFRKHGWTVPPKTRTAPIIDRLQPVSDELGDLRPAR
jgi:hypothetical protein